MAKKENPKRNPRATDAATKPAARARGKRAASTTAPETAQRTASEPSGASESFSDGIRRAAARYWFALLPAMLAVIASITSLNNGFAADDLQQVLNNELIKNLGNLPAAFTSSVWAFMGDNIIFAADQYYRPMFNALLTINYAIAGNSAWAWHLVNVLIHAMVSLLVYVVIKEMTARKWLSVIAASIFAVHPVHTESVAWISGVTDPLMALMLLPAFYFYLRYRKTGRNYQIALSLFFFLLGLLSKETAIAFPIAILCCELIYFDREASFKERAKRAAYIIALFAAPIFVYLIMRYNALGMMITATPARYTLIDTLLTVPLAIAKYLELMFAPAGYSYQHYTPIVESASSLSFIGPLLLMAAIATAVWLTRSPLLRFAAAWFIVFLAPALAGMTHFDPEYLVQERYLYLPSIGVCLALALGIEWIAGRESLIPYAKKAAAAIAAVIIIALGVVHIRQNQAWHDNISVYKNTVDVYPDSAIAHASLARAYYESGRPREAEEQANVALQLDPKSPIAYLTLSYFAQRTAQLNKAISHLETAVSEVRLGPMTRKELATIHLNLARLYSDRAAFAFKQTKTPSEEDIDRAEEHYLKTLEISPRPVAWYYAGQFYLGATRFEEAKAMYQLVIDNVPQRFGPVHVELGLVYQGLNQPEKAIAEYEKYLGIAPPDAKERKDIEAQIERLRRTSSTDK